jgi:TolA-binding protein
MNTTSSKTARAVIAAVVLCASFGAARAEQVYELPSGAAVMISSFSDEEREGQAAARALAERRQQMIEDCEQNNGTDCEREVDTELRAEALQSGARIIHVRPAR